MTNHRHKTPATYSSVGRGIAQAAALSITALLYASILFAFLAWLTVLPSVGFLWVVGWL